MVTMKEFENKLSLIASIIGDKSRSVMLWNLMDGKAYTATELSLCADISPQSASNHLAKLVKTGILTVTKQGRHRYFSFSSPEAARVMESMATLLPPEPDRVSKSSPEPVGIAYARTCYDHIAGRVGVALTESLVKNRLIASSGEDYLVTGQGKDWFASLGLDVEEIRSQRRSFARQCLDWSERKPHLAGALGGSLLRMMLQKNWVRKTKMSRELFVTAAGRSGLRDVLNLEI